jgi:hypothetical protein
MSEIEQRTEEWHKARTGRFTGSRFADVLAKSKKDGKPLKARQDLIWTIVAERIQGYQESGLEIKSPKSPEIHLQRWIDGVPEEYMPQIQGALWVTGRKWCDFVSFDPDTDERFRLLVIRVERDEEFIKHLAAEVQAAEVEAQALYNELMKKAA